MTSFTDCPGTSFTLRRVSRAGGEGMPWRTMDVHEQRVEFVVAPPRKSKPFRPLGHEFGISRPTGYFLLRPIHRHRGQGDAPPSPHPPPTPPPHNPTLLHPLITSALR